jgi:hypothetical protein
MGIVFTLAAFGMSWWLGLRSLGAGMAVVLTTGYIYGIARANYLDGLSHFMFDAAVFGLYLARFSRRNALLPPDARGLASWVWVLIGWPFMLLACFGLFPQHPLIQLVGLRAAIWFVPVLLLGASARREDLILIARTFAVLDVVALAFAVGEYFLGVERFYPKNASTYLIYMSNDVAGHTALRIPATFGSSASYGSAMVASIPWLVGRWHMPGASLLERGWFAGALVAAALGTFMCGSRSPVIILIALGAFFAYYVRIRLRYVIPMLAIAIVVGYFVSGNDRLQRFTTLQDTDMVGKRVQGSMHLGAIDLILECPLGTGLGSAFGTSIPSFLKHLHDQPQIGTENEYCRIALEQGLVGMGLWAAFLIWFSIRRRADPPKDWTLGSKMALAYTLISWGTAFIGCGLLTAVPSTLILLFQMGTLSRDRLLVIPVQQSSRRASGRTLQRRDMAAAQG